MTGIHLFRWRCVAAVVSGVLLSTAFAPLNWHWSAWVAFIPLLAVSCPLKWAERLAVGFIFGYSHFCTSLLWLNEVGFGAGFLLSIWCALFPMAWYGLWGAILWQFKKYEPKKLRQCDYAGLLFINHNGLMTLAAIGGVSLWIALEWLRSVLFTGIAWNLIGMTQMPNLELCSLAVYGGIYAISACVILANLLLTVEIGRSWWTLTLRHLQFPWHIVAAVIVALISWYAIAREKSARQIMADSINQPDVKTIRVLAVQGNIPQCREWTGYEYEDAWNTYNHLTQDALGIAKASVDLVVWPECAVPVPLCYDDYAQRLKTLLDKIHLPLLAGILDYRLKEGAELNNGMLSEEKLLSFNSVFLLTEHSPVLRNPWNLRTDVYDKIHRVPFGEFVPFSECFPWLVELIGMGRNLTPGQTYKVFTLPNNIFAGINICFEDVFPENSRIFCQKGAELLLTLTNDAWYNESCGSKQHLAHAVFRAIENRRPLLRSGNNADTCLINYDGSIQSIIYRKDREFLTFFTEGTLIMDVSVAASPEMTFYTRYGNVLAGFFTLLASAFLGFVFACRYREKRANLEIIRKK